MKTLDYLAAAKKKLNVDSDYALAQRLSLTRQAISKLQAGKHTLSDETAIKIAGILGIHPGLVILDMHRERASSPEQVGVWTEIAKGFLALLLPAKSVAV